MFSEGRNSRKDGGSTTNARVKEKFPSPTRRILSVVLKGIMCWGVALPLPLLWGPRFNDFWSDALTAWAASCFFFSRDCWDSNAPFNEDFLPFAIWYIKPEFLRWRIDSRCCRNTSGWEPSAPTWRESYRWYLTRRSRVHEPPHKPLPWPRPIYWYTLLSTQLFTLKYGRHRLYNVCVAYIEALCIADRIRASPKEQPVRKQVSCWQESSKTISPGATGKTQPYQSLGIGRYRIRCCRRRCVSIW